MHKIILFPIFLLISTASFADSLRVGCLKLERICSEKDRCVWAGNPGQALYVDLVKTSTTTDSEIYKGSLDWTLDGQKFTLSVMQKRMTDKNPINYISLDMPVTKDIVVSSEGLIYSHVKYVNKQQGVTIRCSTGI
ncbi:hypothetical protein K2X05_05260 [bacterium]|nr:hypothetical protein [bacterium]